MRRFNRRVQVAIGGRRVIKLSEKHRKDKVRFLAEIIAGGGGGPEIRCCLWERDAVARPRQEEGGTPETELDSGDIGGDVEGRCTEALPYVHGMHTGYG